jgi:hypothetical protein
LARPVLGVAAWPSSAPIQAPSPLTFCAKGDGNSFENGKKKKPSRPDVAPHFLALFVVYCEVFLFLS